MKSLIRIARFLWSGGIVRLFRNKTSYDFSEVEASPSGSFEIQKLVSEAGQAAASEAKAVGIPKIFARNGQILREYPDGKIEVVTEGFIEKMFFRHINSGVLHARKK
ncbi:MAG: hypothetical protein Q8927_10930 [Bacteroidota bacterium]|nr:hypothetical protein [Bacteroidota bacterium]MDP4216704.1 hypothetical protein [Bacteroidota bacterium]MDP4245969.1 hypothetical protein [Bacteroidota bacterium]MDP4253596.1 hypothetical protein [Bacteroidota bacterium]MDP4257249.1 hypothetical protein [Bacteroidota bacterium]